MWLRGRSGTPLIPLSAEAELASLGLRMPEQPSIELDSICDTANGVVHGWHSSLEAAPSEDLGA